MTFPQRRLDELAEIARIRPLTDDEQREVLLRAKQDRRNHARRCAYEQDQQRRQSAQERARDYRRRTPGYWRCKQC